MKPQELLASLGPEDAVIVGDNLWDLDEGDWFVGGEQRLLKTLAELLRTSGLRAFAIQPHPTWGIWEGDGIAWIGVPTSRHGWKRWWWNRTLHAHLSPKARVVYSYAELAHPRRVPGAIIWQHGVAWDGRSPKNQCRARRQNRAVLEDCGAIVCVDTNFPNVLATSLRRLDRLHEVCVYIPNFPGAVPKVTPSIPPGEPHVVYVRRFGKARGTDLMVEAARQLWDEGLAFSLELVGHSPDGHEESILRTRLAAELQSGRASLHKLPFTRVHEAYERGSLAVVPTRQGEGTSLACLEAFAFGLPVIATWIGGLPNLVQDDLNGKLVAPTLTAVTSALRELIQNPQDLVRLRQGALETADRFSQSRWEKQVLALLRRQNWIS